MELTMNRKQAEKIQSNYIARMLKWSQEEIKDNPKLATKTPAERTAQNILEKQNEKEAFYRERR